jgi:hypothetical protein
VRGLVPSPEKPLTLTSYLCKGDYMDGATPSSTHRGMLSLLYNVTGF